MNYENAQIVIQLVSAMEDAVKKMEEYYGRKDIAGFESAKKSVLSFQKQIDDIISKEKQK